MSLGETIRKSEDDIAGLQVDIVSDVTMNDIGNLKKRIINYMVKYSKNGMPDVKNSVNPILVILENNDKNIKNSIYDKTAILLYDQILKSVSTKNLKNTLRFTNSYMNIFKNYDDPLNYRQVMAIENKINFALAKISFK